MVFFAHNAFPFFLSTKKYNYKLQNTITNCYFLGNCPSKRCLRICFDLSKLVTNICPWRTKHLKACPWMICGRLYISIVFSRLQSKIETLMMVSWRKWDYLIACYILQLRMHAHVIACFQKLKTKKMKTIIKT